MIVSEARREANRRNAQRSTGPRTEEGKARSRQNALTHGLSAEVLRLPEDGPASADPALDWPGFLVEQVGVITSKLRRCDKLDRRHRERISHRAEHHWDDDRRLEAEFLGSGLARNPAEVSRSLRMSPQGCDWMAERWALLARAADRDGSWTPEQRALAFDLLGIPPTLRGEDPCEQIDPDGRPLPALEPAALARREIAALRRRKSDLAPSDARARSWARTDPDEGDDADLRKLYRHESDLHRRLRWCVAQLARVEQPASASSPPPPPAPCPAPSPPPLPRAEPRRDPLPDLGFDFGPFGSFDELMARAEAQIDIEDRRLAEVAAKATARPDPQVAREKARQAARREKRDR